MKFKIKEVDKKEEPVVELWLEKRGKEIVLEVGDSRGNTKHLMVFRKGRFARALVAQLEGLETDSEGRIKEEE